MNRLTLIGKVHTEPEVNSSETKVSFEVEVERTYEHDGQSYHVAEQFPIVAFNNERQIARLLKAGDHVMIDGVANNYNSDYEDVPQRVRIVADQIREFKKSL